MEAMENVRSAHVFDLTLSIKGILFGVWDLLQNSFVSGNIYRLRKNIIKSNLTHFTWC